MELREYLNKFIRRYDKESCLKYFEPKNYEGLNMDAFSFVYRNQKLNGGYFYYPNFKKDELVIFVNGIGSGYISYMTEIERLAKEGFKVLCIDNLGDFSSEGENIRSLTEALAINDALLNYLSTLSWYKDTKIKMIGHSLGGYVVGNIMNYHPEIKAIVVMSGLVSIETILKSQNASDDILNYEKEMNPKYYYSNAIDAIKDKNVPMLFIHSEDDKVVSYQDNFMYLKNNVNNPNVKFLNVKNKGHNPDYTEDGVNYMRDEFAKLYSLDENEALEYSNKIDFKRITKLDENVFEEIVKTLIY